MVEIGQVVEVSAKSGKTVQRKCVAVIDAKYLAEQKQLVDKNGFAPMFVKEGKVWLGMTPASRKKLSDAEIKRREAVKKENHDKFVARVEKNAEKREKATAERREKAAKRLADSIAKDKARLAAKEAKLKAK